MIILDKYAIVQRIAECLRREEYDMQLKLDVSTLDAHMASWGVYNDFMTIVFHGKLL